MVHLIFRTRLESNMNPTLAITRLFLLPLLAMGLIFDGFAAQAGQWSVLASPASRNAKLRVGCRAVKQPRPRKSVPSPTRPVRRIIVRATPRQVGVKRLCETRTLATPNDTSLGRICRDRAYTPSSRNTSACKSDRCMSAWNARSPLGLRCVSEIQRTRVLRRGTSRQVRRICRRRIKPCLQNLPSLSFWLA